jgi:hypothetical protein
MYRDSIHLPKKYLKRTQQKELEQIRRMEAILRRGVEQGVFKVKDPFFTASMLFYQMASPALRGWTFHGKYSEKKLDNLLEDYILRNILA